ncbi:MAG: catalase-related domain-containing protein, partial [Vulcanimicrobiaceae bacterium]
VREGGFASYPEQIDGPKRRVRPESFKDHFSQATLFWKSMSPVEQDHIVGAFSFELAKVEREPIRQRVLDRMLANIDGQLAERVAANIGLTVERFAPPEGKRNGKAAKLAASPALSLLNQPQSAKTRKVAILAAPGVADADVAAMKKALAAAGVRALVIAPRLGVLAGVGGTVAVDHTLVTMPSVVFDAVYLPGGPDSVQVLAEDGDAVHFIAEAYRHCKAIAVTGEATELLDAAGIRADGEPVDGLIVADDAHEAAAPFLAAIAAHRAWARADKDAVPA